MRSPATTKLSSKGQVVIPEEVRDQMGLKEGHRFAVLGHGDTVILKTITPPSREEFDVLLRQLRADFKKAGIKKSDLTKAIRDVRREKRKR